MKETAIAMITEEQHHMTAGQKLERLLRAVQTKDGGDKKSASEVFEVLFESLSPGKDEVAVSTAKLDKVSGLCVSTPFQPPLSLLPSFERIGWVR